VLQSNLKRLNNWFNTSNCYTQLT